MKRRGIFLVILGLLIIGSVFWNRAVRERDAAQKQSGESQTINITATAPTTCSKQALPELTEGPYYKAGSPERQRLREEGTQGVPLRLEGFVLDTACKPIANAGLDFWQTDGEGNYDNAGYKLRGHQFTDSSGKYTLETVVPGHYTGRTEHIHFKIKASDSSPEITSQLFLPGSSSNLSDSIFDEALIIDMKDAPDANGKVATYNFVVNR